MRSTLWIRVATVAIATFVTPLAAQTPADTIVISLPEAVRRAEEQSEEIRLARTRVSLAGAQITAARSAALPQVDASLGYTKTLASPFDQRGSFQLPDSLRFQPDPSAPLDARVRYLERRTPLAALGGLGQLFSDLPFGQENSYTAYVRGSQLLYAGGRIGAALDIARSYQDASQLSFAEQMAEVNLQVRTAYYRALLAQRLEAIATEALAQAERFLEQERLRLRAGEASELEVMRAEVSRDNLRPQLVEARNAAELSMLNLKRLVDVPLQQPVRLSTELRAPASADLQEAAETPEALVARRAAVQAAEQQVSIGEQQVRIARGAFLPNVSLQMNYGRQIFPSEMFRFNEDWREDWTVALAVQVPLFSGMRRGAELEQARLQLEETRLRLTQLRESVQLQYQQARGERERARVAIAARQRTSEVAERVYDLTVLRYEQGMATQLEVSDARLALLQARTHLAQAIADFYIADAALERAQAHAQLAS